MFAEKKGFNDEQTSAFLSIIKSIHERAVGKFKFITEISIWSYKL